MSTLAENTDSTRRWVLDTNVLLDWLVFRDVHLRQLVAAIEAGGIMLACRADTRDEFVRVLEYPQVKKYTAACALALKTYDRWHTGYVGQERDVVLPLCRDPDDQKFLEVARDAAAHWLISKDRALLELHQRARRTAGFSILHPEEATQQLYNAR